MTISKPDSSKGSRPRATIAQRKARKIDELQQIAGEERKKTTRGKVLWGSKLPKFAETSPRMQAVMHQLYLAADPRDQEALRLACASFDVTVPPVPSVMPGTTDQAGKTTDNASGGDAVSAAPSATSPSPPAPGTTGGKPGEATPTAAAKAAAQPGGADRVGPGSGTHPDGSFVENAPVAPAPPASNAPPRETTHPAGTTKTGIPTQTATAGPIAAVPTNERSG